MAPATKPQRLSFAHAYAVIMAGGSGTRFWPMSRRNCPKQLLGLFGGTTLLEQAVRRLRGIIPRERIYIFTNQLVHRQVLRLFPEIPRRQIVAEPAQRNTAPTIGLAAHEVFGRDPRGIMVVLPADHLIGKSAVFQRALGAACGWAAREGRSVILGIKPTRAETGYGYVRLGKLETCAGGQKIFRVRRFTEKPKVQVARRYVASGQYLWNAGMFIWRASTLLVNLRRFQPKMAESLESIAAAGGIDNPAKFKRLFPHLDKISIDYALMEELSGVFAIAADIGWNDVGSWTVAYDLNPKDAEDNVRPPRSIAIGSKGNMILADRAFVAAIGVKNLIVVQSGDALLVCSREHSQDVGKAVQELERRGLVKLL